MLMPPLGGAQRRALLAAFGIEFEVEFDDGGDIASEIATMRTAIPFYIVQLDGELARLEAARKQVAGSGVLAELIARELTASEILKVRHSEHNRRIRAQARLSDRDTIPRRLGALDLISPFQGGIVGFSYVTRSLFALRRDTVLWIYAGEADDALDSPLDLKEAHGLLYLLDAGKRRLTVIDGSGRLVKHIPLAGSHQRFAFAKSRGFALFDDPTREGRWLEIDSAGSPRGEHPLAESLLGLSILQREARVVNIRDSETIALAYVRGSRLDLVDLRQPAVREGRMVESIPFPKLVSWKEKDGTTVIRVDPHAFDASLDVTSDASHIYVLFAGETSMAGRVVDVYSPDGEYLESIELAERAQMLRCESGGFLTVDESGRIVSHWTSSAAIRIRPTADARGQS
jgi:hypothetical protein